MSNSTVTSAPVDFTHLSARRVRNTKRTRCGNLREAHIPFTQEHPPLRVDRRPEPNARKHWIREHVGAIGTLRGLLLELSERADPAGCSFPSVAELARALHVTIRWTQILLRKLEDLDLIRCWQRMGIDAGRGPTNVYQVVYRGCTCGRRYNQLGRPIDPSARFRMLTRVDPYPHTRTRLRKDLTVDPTRTSSNVLNPTLWGEMTAYGGLTPY